jgi:hypothetical protein
LRNPWENEGAVWERSADFYLFLPQHPGMDMEDEALGLDEALARGFARFVKFLGASKLDATECWDLHRAFLPNSTAHP